MLKKQEIIDKLIEQEWYLKKSSSGKTYILLHKKYPDFKIELSCFGHDTAFEYIWICLKLKTKRGGYKTCSQTSINSILDISNFMSTIYNYRLYEGAKVIVKRKQPEKLKFVKELSKNIGKIIYYNGQSTRVECEGIVYIKDDCSLSNDLAAPDKNLLFLIHIDIINGSYRKIVTDLKVTFYYDVTKCVRNKRQAEKIAHLELDSLNCIDRFLIKESIGYFIKNNFTLVGK